MPSSRVAVVALDGSEYSLNAFRFAARLLNPQVWRLVLVHIIDEFLVETAAEAGISIEEFLERNARRVLGDIEAEASRMGFRVESIAKPGKPHDEIINIALEKRAELIVMGSRGLRGLKRLILGSVSSYVASHSPIPVLIVPMARETR